MGLFEVPPSRAESFPVSLAPKFLASKCSRHSSGHRIRGREQRSAVFHQVAL